MIQLTDFNMEKMTVRRFIFMFSRLSFSHITTVSGCEWALNAHFLSAVSLKYHSLDTWRGIPPSNIRLTRGRPVPLSQCLAPSERAANTILLVFGMAQPGSNPQPPKRKADNLATEPKRK